MTKHSCNECGHEIEHPGRPFNYCPRCGALAPHWQAACRDLLNLANKNRYLDDSIRLFGKNAYLDSARTALISLETQLRELGETERHGVDLVKYVLGFEFNPNENRLTREPLVKINNLATPKDRSEQEGFQLLVLGLFKGLRNILIHQQVPLNPINSMSIVIMCNMTLDILKDGSFRNERTCTWTRVRQSD